MQIMIRMLSSEARVDSRSMRSGYLTPEEMVDLTHAAGVISEAPIYIDDTAAITVTELKAKARRLKNERGLDLVVLDYLQLMQGRRDAERRDLEDRRDLAFAQGARQGAGHPRHRALPAAPRG